MDFQSSVTTAQKVLENGYNVPPLESKEKDGVDQLQTCTSVTATETSEKSNRVAHANLQSPACKVLFGESGFDGANKFSWYCFSEKQEKITEAVEKVIARFNFPSTAYARGVRLFLEDRLVKIQKIHPVCLKFPGSSEEELFKIIGPMASDYRMVLDAEKIQQLLRTAGANARCDGAYQFDIQFTKPQSEGVSLESYKVKAFLENGVGVAYARGRRPQMQDDYLVDEFVFGEAKVTILGIFDGHGLRGDAAALWVKNNLKKVLIHHLVQWQDGPLDKIGNIFNAFTLAMVNIGEGCKSTESEAGTTAVVALLFDYQDRKKELYVGNVGDSRLVLVDKGGFIQATEDAKPDKKEFEKEIKDRGGFVTKAKDGQWVVAQNLKLGGTALSMTSSFGDGDVPSVTPRPVITYYGDSELKNLKDLKLVLGCDGLFDVFSSRQVANRVKELEKQEKNPERIAEKIVYEAIARRSYDNISVLVYPLEDTEE